MTTTTTTTTYFCQFLTVYTSYLCISVKQDSLWWTKCQIHIYNLDRPTVHTKTCKHI